MSNPLPLDQDTIDRLDDAAPLIVDAVHCGDAEAIDRLLGRLDRTELLGLVISVASLAMSPEQSAPVLSLVDPTEGWSAPGLRAAHAAYHGGDRRERTKQGERIYQRLKKQESKRRARGLTG